MSRLVSPAEMRALEAAAFARGATAEAFMEEAGAQIAAAVQQFFPQPGCCLIYAGKGHNGDDAKIAGRHLKSAGWEVIQRGEFPPAHRPRRGPFVVLDALLGIGSKGPLRAATAQLTREVNALGRQEGAHVFAVDVPTGLDADSGAADPDCVIADTTLTIGAPKLGLVADGATAFTGRLAVLPLSGLELSVDETRDQLISAEAVRGVLPKRRFDAHKGDFGRIGIIAGSLGFTGAALLAAEGAAQAGGGLVTLYVTDEVHAILATATSPAVMVKPVRSYLEALEDSCDVLAIGPGLGRARGAEVLELIRRALAPMVVDADALNLLATDLSPLAHAAGPRLLTPHPGEMKRLLPEAHGSRREIAQQFVERHEVTLLYKGSRTIIAERGRPFAFNSTGHPGMSTGGIGDTLTGMLAALLGSGLTPYDAARLGAWLSGRAAEIALFERDASEQSLCAPDLLANLGRAFRSLRDGDC